MALLSEQEIREKLAKLEGWAPVGKEIQKVYTFRSFMPAIEFVNKVAEIAEKEQHHPDIAVSWNKVTLTLSTHSEGGVTQKDVDTAALFNKAA